MFTFDTFSIIKLRSAYRNDELVTLAAILDLAAISSVHVCSHVDADVSKDHVLNCFLH